VYTSLKAWPLQEAGGDKNVTLERKYAWKNNYCRAAYHEGGRENRSALLVAIKKGEGT